MFEIEILGSGQEELWLAIQKTKKMMSQSKVYVIGPSRVGKTKLIKHLSGESVPLKYASTYSPTALCSITNVDASEWQRNSQTDKKTIEFWELGGAENYRPIQAALLDKNAVYIFVCRPQYPDWMSQICSWKSFFDTSSAKSAQVLAVAMVDDNFNAEWSRTKIDWTFLGKVGWNGPIIKFQDDESTFHTNQVLDRIKQWILNHSVTVSTPPNCKSWKFGKSPIVDPMFFINELSEHVAVHCRDGPSLVQNRSPIANVLIGGKSEIPNILIREKLAILIPDETQSADLTCHTTPTLSSTTAALDLALQSESKAQVKPRRFKYSIPSLYAEIPALDHLDIKSGFYVPERLQFGLHQQQVLLVRLIEAFAEWYPKRPITMYRNGFESLGDRCVVSATSAQFNFYWEIVLFSCPGYYHQVKREQRIPSSELNLRPAEHSGQATTTIDNVDLIPALSRVVVLRGQHYGYIHKDNLALFSTAALEGILIDEGELEILAPYLNYTFKVKRKLNLDLGPFKPRDTYCWLELDTCIDLPIAGLDATIFWQRVCCRQAYQNAFEFSEKQYVHLNKDELVVSYIPPLSSHLVLSDNQFLAIAEARMFYAATEPNYFEPLILAPATYPKAYHNEFSLCSFTAGMLYPHFNLVSHVLPHDWTKGFFAERQSNLKEFASVYYWVKSNPQEFLEILEEREIEFNNLDFNIDMPLITADIQLEEQYARFGDPQFEDHGAIKRHSSEPSTSSPKKQKLMVE